MAKCPIVFWFLGSSVDKECILPRPALQSIRWKQTHTASAIINIFSPVLQPRACLLCSYSAEQM